MQESKEKSTYTAKEQVAPANNNTTPIWDLVIQDMQTRDNVGRSRYNTPLQIHNGRNSLQDMYDEILDFVVYCKQAQEELKIVGNELRDLLYILETRGGIYNEFTIGESISVIKSILEKNKLLA